MMGRSGKYLLTNDIAGIPLLALDLGGLGDSVISYRLTGAKELGSSIDVREVRVWSE